jgi:hypothetical protein
VQTIICPRIKLHLCPSNRYGKKLKAEKTNVMKFVSCTVHVIEKSNSPRSFIVRKSCVWKIKIAEIPEN